MTTVTEVEVLSINLGQRLAFRDDSVLGRITTLLDSDGDETDQTDEAVAFVVCWSDREWSAHRVDDFEPQRRQ